jgi:hypothetical protein
LRRAGFVLALLPVLFGTLGVLGTARDQSAGQPGRGTVGLIGNWQLLFHPVPLIGLACTARLATLAALWPGGQESLPPRFSWCRWRLRQTVCSMAWRCGSWFLQTMTARLNHRHIAASYEWHRFRRRGLGEAAGTSRIDVGSGKMRMPFREHSWLAWFEHRPRRESTKWSLRIIHAACDSVLP